MLASLQKLRAHVDQLHIRHGTALDQVNARRARSPAGVALPLEFRAPTEPARGRRDQVLHGSAWAGLGADAAENHDLAARLEHAGKLVERGFRVRDRGDDVLRDHHVECIVGKIQMLGVHDLKRLDMIETLLDDAIARLAEHGFRDIHADNPVGARVVGERNAGSDADLENAAADAFRRDDSGTPAALEHRPEHEIVNRRPAVIGPFHRASFDIDRYCHYRSPCIRFAGVGALKRPRRGPTAAATAAPPLD